MSLLQANGHPNAPRYPVGKVFMETQYVVERINRDHATYFGLLQLTVGSVLSKKAGSEFKKQMKKLAGD